jgi:hypothetical protein
MSSEGTALSALIDPHDPGGKVRQKLPEGVATTAVFGGAGNEFRYRLSRRWGDGPWILFIMMNPSTADLAVDDPTVAKCGRLARRWGDGGLLVGNTFAYRATAQDRLAAAADPVGPENDTHLLDMAREAAMTVFAYGTPKHPRLRARGPEVARMIRADGIQPYVLRLSKDGVPYHPLYLSESLVPVAWEG